MSVKGWRVAAAAVVAAVAVVAVALVAPSATSGPTMSLRGGTYRVGWEEISFDALDPTGAYPDTFGILSSLLVRTLVGYEHVAGAAGNRLVPDLATSLPAATDGGRRYTFRLKPGVRFGPPVNREIRSGDIRYALERLARSHPGLQHGLYFEVIRGFDAFRRGRAPSIAGITTAGPRTITFELTRPASEFPYALTLPAAAPIPAEVARCFKGSDDGYNFDLVSSGPYMIAGAGGIRIDSCSAIQPMRGVSRERLTLVRNPGYDPRTDSPAARESNPDRFEFVAVVGRGQARNAAEIGRRLEAGELDDAILTSSPKVLAPLIAAARKRGLLRVSAPYGLAYVVMNLTQPPFDDVHVRRALAWALDRSALRDAWGGSAAGSIPQHVIPDEMLGSELRDYAPFETAGSRGDLTRAKAELARSKYRTRNGMCIADACKWVSLSPVINCTCYAAGQRMSPLIRDRAAQLGIRLQIHSRNFDKVFRPSENTPSTPNGEWFVDYPDPSSFLTRHLRGAGIPAVDNWNVSLVGITPAQARRLGVKGSVKGVPSIDRDLARCGSLTGRDRTACWVALDRRLTTDVVPWIPFLRRNRFNILGRQVAKWSFDQSTGMTAFAHVALKR